ncbi:MAG: DJ-1/PfpI family protein [Clostridia bacterium]|nr:DJ-1/PfpI family protein [Clostridia bacterium]
MIYLLLADGFEEAEALVPLDLLRRAGLPVQTVAITASPVVGSHGIPVVADITPREATEPIDLLIFPGGLPGATNLDESPEAEALLRRALAEDARIAAICAAPLILGKRGLLDGKRAICYPGFEEYLAGAEIATDARVVTDGRITTGIGMGAAAEFGLELVSLLASPAVADKLANAAFIPSP